MNDLPDKNNPPFNDEEPKKPLQDIQKLQEENLKDHIKNEMELDPWQDLISELNEENESDFDEQDNIETTIQKLEEIRNRLRLRRAELPELTDSEIEESPVIPYSKILKTRESAIAFKTKALQSIQKLIDDNDISGVNETMGDYLTRARKIFTDEYHLGNSFYEKGEYQSAGKIYDVGILINPSFSEMLFNRGLCNYNLKKFPVSSEDYKVSLILDGSNPVIYNNLGDVYYRQQRFPKAIKCYTTSLNLNPHYLKAFYNRGLAACCLQDYKCGVSDFSEVLSLNSTFAEAYHIRGLAFDYLNRLDEAIRDYNAALTNNPDFTEAKLHKRIAEQRRDSGVVNPITVSGNTVDSLIKHANVEHTKQVNYRKKQEKSWVRLQSIIKTKRKSNIPAISQYLINTSDVIEWIMELNDPDVFSSILKEIETTLDLSVLLNGLKQIWQITEFEDFTEDKMFFLARLMIAIESKLCDAFTYHSDKLLEQKEYESALYYTAFALDLIKVSVKSVADRYHSVSELYLKMAEIAYLLMGNNKSYPSKYCILFFNSLEKCSENENNNHKRNFFIHLWKARFYNEKEIDPNRAIDEYATVIEIIMNDDSIEAEYKYILKEAFYNQAKLYFEQADFEKAAELFDELVQVDIDYLDSVYKLIICYYNLNDSHNLALTGCRGIKRNYHFTFPVYDIYFSDNVELIEMVKHFLDENYTAFVLEKSGMEVLLFSYLFQLIEHTSQSICILELQYKTLSNFEKLRLALLYEYEISNEMNLGPEKESLLDKKYERIIEIRESLPHSLPDDLSNLEQLSLAYNGFIIAKEAFKFSYYEEEKNKSILNKSIRLDKELLDFKETLPDKESWYWANYSFAVSLFNLAFHYIDKKYYYLKEAEGYLKKALKCDATNSILRGSSIMLLSSITSVRNSPSINEIIENNELTLMFCQKILSKAKKYENSLLDAYLLTGTSYVKKAFISRDQFSRYINHAISAFKKASAIKLRINIIHPYFDIARCFIYINLFSKKLTNVLKANVETLDFEEIINKDKKEYFSYKLLLAQVDYILNLESASLQELLNNIEVLNTYNILGKVYAMKGLNNGELSDLKSAVEKLVNEEELWPAAVISMIIADRYYQLNDTTNYFKFLFDARNIFIKTSLSLNSFAGFIMGLYCEDKTECHQSVNPTYNAVKDFFNGKKLFEMLDCFLSPEMKDKHKLAFVMEGSIINLIATRNLETLKNTFEPLEDKFREALQLKEHLLIGFETDKSDKSKQKLLEEIYFNGFYSFYNFNSDLNFSYSRVSSFMEKVKEDQKDEITYQYKKPIQLLTKTNSLDPLRSIKYLIHEINLVRGILKPSDKVSLDAAKEQVKRIIRIIDGFHYKDFLKYKKDLWQFSNANDVKGLLSVLEDYVVYIDKKYTLLEVFHRLRKIYNQNYIFFDSNLQSVKYMNKTEMVKLERALGLLIQNAVDAIVNIDDPKIVVKINAEPDFYLIKIQDNGQGMDQYTQEQWESSNKYSSRENGSGVGRTLARDHINEIGGILQLASSAPGKGTVIEIVLGK